MQQAVIMRNSARFGGRVKNVEEIARVVRTFLAISGNNAADTQRVRVQADRQLDVHLKRNRRNLGSEVLSHGYRGLNRSRRGWGRKAGQS